MKDKELRKDIEARSDNTRKRFEALDEEIKSLERMIYQPKDVFNMWDNNVNKKRKKK